MNELALFAGAGGGILGGKLLGWRTVCAVEIDPYAASVLVQRQNDGILPPFPIWDDIRTFNGKTWHGIVDVVSGGFPCQAFSNASHGRIVAGTLWPEMLRVIGEVSPRFVFAENTSEDAIIAAQADLADAGYTTIRACVGAKDVGADHPRKRWWLLADSNDKSKLGGNLNAKMALISKYGQMLWSAKPCDTRMDDGLASRMDRFKAIGNGQIPAVVKFAWGILS